MHMVQAATPTGKNLCPCALFEEACHVEVGADKKGRASHEEALGGSGAMSLAAGTSLVGAMFSLLRERRRYKILVASMSLFSFAISPASQLLPNK